MTFCMSTSSNSCLIEEVVKYLLRTRVKSAQLTRMCLTVRGQWQVIHSGWSSPDKRYKCFRLVWPIHSLCLYGSAGLYLKYKYLDTYLRYEKCILCLVSRYNLRTVSCSSIWHTINLYVYLFSRDTIESYIPDRLKLLSMMRQITALAQQ